MTRYIIKRLLITIPIILCVVFFVFTLMYFTPGDPAVLILGDTATEEELAAMRAYLGVDRPYIVQLLGYYKQLFIDWDLGTSWVYQTNVSTEIANRLPTTLGICLFSVGCSAILGIPLGVIAAVNQDTKLDKGILLACSVVHCVPGYCFALLFIIVFSLHLRWLPAYGVGGIEYFILPCASIMVGSFAGIARQMRSSMLEVIRSDYVMAAKAQGYSKNVVYYCHALPNALIPIVTQLGTQFAAGLGGTLILETIFSIPGMGLYVSGAITKRDHPAALGCVVFLSITFVLMMLVIDILYGVLDPRIRAQYENSVKKRKRKGRKN